MGLLAFLSGCGGGKMDHYKGTSPDLKLEEYFNGPLKAWGVVQDYRGRVTRRFDIDLMGSWDGNTGTLEEYFVYYDGETQERTWNIKKISDNEYEGTAGDIIGTATGKTEGNAMRWAYVMDLKVGDNKYHITFDDWMFLMNDGVLVNRSYLKKFGVTVAELTIFMKKQNQE
jgi:hypothetical protein